METVHFEEKHVFFSENDIKEQLNYFICIFNTQLTFYRWLVPPKKFQYGLPWSLPAQVQGEYMSIDHTQLILLTSCSRKEETSCSPANHESWFFLELVEAIRRRCTLFHCIVFNSKQTHFQGFFFAPMKTWGVAWMQIFMISLTSHYFSRPSSSIVKERCRKKTFDLSKAIDLFLKVAKDIWSKNFLSPPF